jgi:hypothetical protein
MVVTNEHDEDVTEPSVPRRWTRVAVVVAATVAVGLLAATAGAIYVRNEIFDNELPSCGREPVVVEWTQREGRWSRSATFELVDDSQTVQVDLTLQRDDGGVIQTGKTLYVVPAGGSVPADDAATAPSTAPFRGTIVGSGIDAINEQVTLQAGEWQLIVKGGASPAEVRWPC